MSLDGVKHIVLVLSGKGGVGKSSVTTQLALSLSLAGRSVGVLDMDLTGPSVPRMFRVEDAKVTQAPGGWLPVTVHEADAASGRGSLRVMSLGFMLAGRGDAVVWRGPKKTAMVRQFLSDVLWGALDVLVIDTPPGTSDEHIALAETLQRPAAGPQQQGPRLAGAVVVTTPQAIATADVRKELNFCAKTRIRVLGVVENMSGFVCQNCSECTDIFSRGGGEVMAADFAVPFLAAVPIDPQFGDLIESGIRPSYPEGTAIEGQVMPARARRSASGGGHASPGEGHASPGGDHGDERDARDARDEDVAPLVEKYKDCSLAIIFRRLADDLMSTISTPVATG